MKGSRRDFSHKKQTVMFVDEKKKQSKALVTLFGTFILLGYIGYNAYPVFFDNLLLGSKYQDQQKIILTTNTDNNETKNTLTLDAKNKPGNQGVVTNGLTYIRELTLQDLEDMTFEELSVLAENILMYLKEYDIDEKTRAILTKFLDLIFRKVMHVSDFWIQDMHESVLGSEYLSDEILDERRTELVNLLKQIRIELHAGRTDWTIQEVFHMLVDYSRFKDKYEFDENLAREIMELIAPNLKKAFEAAGDEFYFEYLDVSLRILLPDLDVEFLEDIVHTDELFEGKFTVEDKKTLLLIAERLIKFNPETYWMFIELIKSMVEGVRTGDNEDTINAFKDLEIEIYNLETRLQYKGPHFFKAPLIGEGR